LARGNPESLADSVELAGAPVFGQGGGEVELYAEEVVDGVFVFAAVEAAQHGAFSGLMRGGQRRREIFAEEAFFPVRRRFVFPGRHFSIGDAIIEAHPLFHDRLVVEIMGEGIEVEAALGGVRVVAFVAMLVEKRHEFFAEISGVCG